MFLIDKKTGVHGHAGGARQGGRFVGGDHVWVWPPMGFENGFKPRALLTQERWNRAEL